ncbi:hypothetical protein EMPG_14874 [Blastomyces silverae]|uniref:Uncharacterized protein n=1 Tax=Blastomyces silverae TaxID=2060906 RepID=A0A0H1BKJ3_9EURO|nr:hypothetical protein EMPG_14874 [Blastomyces silverae]
MPAPACTPDSYVFGMREVVTWTGGLLYTPGLLKQMREKWWISNIRCQSSTNTSRRNQFDLRHRYVEDKPMITTLFGSDTVEICSTRSHFPASPESGIQRGGYRSNSAYYALNEGVDILFCLHRKINSA